MAKRRRASSTGSSPGGTDSWSASRAMSQASGARRAAAGGGAPASARWTGVGSASRPRAAMGRRRSRTAGMAAQACPGVGRPARPLSRSARRGVDLPPPYVRLSARTRRRGLLHARATSTVPNTRRVQRMSDERTDTAPARRILVIANETVAGTALHQAIRFRARHGSADVLVVVPTLGGRMRRLAPGGRAAAEDRLARSLERLRRSGVRARGQLGDADPLRAIGDALGLFVADEVLVATHPEARSVWLAGRSEER